jgi:hypothetical protein
MNPIIIGVTSTSRYVHWHTGSPLHWHWQCPFTGKLQSQVVPMPASMHARACQWALPPCPMLPCLAEVPFLCSVIPSKLNEPQAPSQAARPDQPTAQVTVAASADGTRAEGTAPSRWSEVSGSGHEVQWEWDTNPSGHLHTHTHTHTQPHTAILHRSRSRRPIYTENGQFVFSD